MKKIILPLITLAALAVTACSKEPPADQIKGSYNCEARLDTRYMKNGQWRDTSYVSKTSNSVIIQKVDDKTVSITAHSNKWGDAVVESASVSDYNYSANFGGDGTYTRNNTSYSANISGTVTYDSHDMSVSVRVTNYPQSGGKYILSFTNRGI